MIKRSVIICFFSILAVNVFSQVNIGTKYNKAYRDAVYYYDIKEYGKALKNAEDAILFKKQQIQAEVKRLESSLESREVKSVGINIDKVIAKLEERGEKDCIEIINSYVKKYGKNYFENSITRVVEFIKLQDKFPEAEKLIGDIYRLEGEYTFADNYYRKALEHSSILDIPDAKYEILYTMAELSRLTGDRPKMEQRLLEVTGKQNVQRNNLLINRMNNTIKGNNLNAVNKLFELYRADDYYSLSAYSLLSDYYEEEGYMDKAIGYSALAVVTGFSKMDSIISKRNLSYKYTTVDAFFEELQNYEDIIQWGTENNVWKSYNRLCTLCEKAGYKQFSLELLKILAKKSPETYWQKEAVLKIDSMSIN